MDRERREPAQIIDVNLGGVVNALEVARSLPNFRRFVQVSSVAVFGDEPGAATRDEDVVLRQQAVSTVGEHHAESPVVGMPGPVEDIADHEVATIAVIEGRIGGGGSELALSCDMRFAALGRAVFNQPEVALGILPGGSGTVRLPRLIGRSRALESILGCDDIDALTAERWGWVNRALPPDELWPFVQRLAHRISGFPPHAVAAAKAAVLRAERDVVPDLLQEAAAFSATLGEPATRAALAAFMAAGGQTPAGELRLADLVAPAPGFT